jgi:hypothetical protein
VNKPAHPQPPFAEASPPYELDVVGWAQAQARLIRERRFDELDIENIAEEIESVGRSERSSGESALRVLMVHILKWQFQPERRGRSWAGSIATQRVAFEKVMTENPSLKSSLDDMRAYAYRRARIEASVETDLPRSTFPADPPAWEVILDQPFEHEPN